MRTDAENLPLSFLDDFCKIDHEKTKQAVRDIVDVMYDDYPLDDVQEMFSSFPSFAYEVYNMMNLHYEDDDIKRDLDRLIEVVLYCASQLKHR